MIYHQSEYGTIYNGDALNILKQFDSKSINCCVTSPPYWGLRDYGHKDQLGLEKTPEQYVLKIVNIFREVRRILKNNGTLWLNLGDSYVNHSIPGGGDPTIKNRNIGNSQYTSTKVNNLKPKNLIGIPWRVAFALQADGWYLRQDIIWHKPNPMPESVTDRCTKAHEYIFLLSKNPKYYYNNEAIKEPAKPDKSTRNRDETKLNNTPGRTKMQGLKENTYLTKNKRSVWTVATKPYKGAHFATFPPDLIRPCILAGSRKNDIILDPFFGSGTTGYMAFILGRKYIGIELNKEYCDLSISRIEKETQQMRIC